MCISVVVSAEISFGVEKSGGARYRTLMQTVLADLNIVELDQPADRIYGEIRAELARRGTPITPNDYLIAAHALALDATLVTDDAAFSCVPGLKVENWLRDLSAEGK